MAGAFATAINSLTKHDAISNPPVEVVRRARGLTEAVAASEQPCARGAPPFVPLESRLARRCRAQPSSGLSGRASCSSAMASKNQR